MVACFPSTPADELSAVKVICHPVLKTTVRKTRGKGWRKGDPTGATAVFLLFSGNLFFLATIKDSDNRLCNDSWPVGGTELQVESFSNKVFPGISATSHTVDRRMTLGEGEAHGYLLLPTQPGNSIAPGAQLLLAGGAGGASGARKRRRTSGLVMEDAESADAALSLWSLAQTTSIMPTQRSLRKTQPKGLGMTDEQVQ